MELNTLIPLKRSLAKDARAEEVKSQLIQTMQAIANLPTYKANLEFLLHICNLVEYLVRRKDKIDKKALVVVVMQNLFPDLTEDETKMIESNIQFLFDNKRIKAASLLRIGSRMVTSWIKKRLTV